MGSVVHLTISGEDPSQRLQMTLAEGETVRVGRATKHGWVIPWDPKISREHAVLTWVEGRLRVQCLEQAKNPVIFRGQAVREARVGSNEWFQVGKTTFQISHVVEEDGGQRGPGSHPVEFFADDSAECDDRAFSSAELQAAGFRNAERQMEILEGLPEKISASRSDDDLGMVLSQLLLDAIPNAVAVAVAHFDASELPKSLADIDAFPKPQFLRVQARKNYQGRFTPSRRLILKCLQTEECVMHIFEASGERQFTMSEGLGWAFCSPIKTESTRGWCMYVSGRGATHGGPVVREQDLVGDLRFTRLVAQFIGSTRQVRQLQEQRTQFSTFFSPKVIENLTATKSEEILSPAERDISVLFCHVRGVSKKAESLGDDLLTLLHSVSAALSFMVSGIVERDGAIADCHGDAALGFWGWPTESPEGPVPACRTALAIHRGFQQGFSHTSSLLYGFSIGMGIAHGRAVAGPIGTNQQAKVGVFGKVVNQGSRLEGLTRQFNVPVCVDAKTAEFALRYLPPTEGRLRRLALVRPKGMDAPLNVYALLPPLEESSDVTAEMIADYETALDCVIRGEWPAAHDCLNRLPDYDGPTQFLLDHMAVHHNRPPANWDGAFAL